MANFECPSCRREYDIGDYPDHLTDLGRSQTFEFECDGCGGTFDVFVEFEPVLWPKVNSFKPKAAA